MNKQDAIKQLVQQGGVTHEVLDKYLEKNQEQFYAKARKMWTKTQNEQIVKGADKYPEAFNPLNWTPKQLLKHAMQENVDQAHYMVGLYQYIEYLEGKVEVLSDTLESIKEANSGE